METLTRGQRSSPSSGDLPFCVSREGSSVLQILIVRNKQGLSLQERLMAPLLSWEGQWAFSCCSWRFPLLMHQFNFLHFFSTKCFIFPFRILSLLHTVLKFLTEDDATSNRCWGLMPKKLTDFWIDKCLWKSETISLTISERRRHSRGQKESDSLSSGVQRYKRYAVTWADMWRLSWFTPKSRGYIKEE